MAVSTPREPLFDLERERARFEELPARAIVGPVAFVSLGRFGSGEKHLVSANEQRR
jgi:hypothetical protein